MTKEFTPVEKYNSLSSYLGIDLRVKRDDLYPFVGGGNKARKICFILSDAQKNNANALVSAGSANSNHARVVAIAGAKMNWPVHLVIHDSEDYSKGNLQLMKMAGAKLSFVAKENVSGAMDEAMEQFKNAGYNPYYIWGGGHTVDGMKAYYKAVKEFQNQTKDWKPDVVIHASGTGGTQSGLHVGFAGWDQAIKVIGISVARGKERGQMVVEKGARKLSKELDIKQKVSVIFRDEWKGQGYEDTYPRLFEVIRFSAQKEGLITDPTYTGKALTALFDMRESGEVTKDAKVLFWHTGGLINLFDFYKSIR